MFSDSLDLLKVSEESPAKYWIKFLVSRQKHSTEAISAMLSAFQLGGPSDEYLMAIESSMKLPCDFQPLNLKHRPSQNFLRREGIHEAWHRPNSFKEAYGILGNEKVRALIETYILSPLKPKQALAEVKAKTGVVVSEKAYKLFAHYWWNKSLLNGVEWGDYIEKRDAAHREWLQLAVETNDVNGAQILLWKTGAIKNIHADAGKVFRDVRDTSYMCIQQIAHDPPSLPHSQMLLNYSKVAGLAQQQLDASANAMVDIVEHFSQFRIQRSQIETPSITDVTGGNYSGADELVDESEVMELEVSDVGV